MSNRTKNRDPVELKKKLINRIVDLFFDTPQEQITPELQMKFVKWLDNGDFRQEKDGAIMRRMFSESPKHETEAETESELLSALQDDEKSR